MRKAVIAGVAVVALAFVVAPTSWSQARAAEQRDRAVLALDGRGSHIGVSVRDVDADDMAAAKLAQPAGVVVARVEEGSPAEKAGLRAGDVIVEFDGERVRSARHFARLVQETPDGRRVSATVVRDGARQTVNVTPETGGGLLGGDVWVDLPEIERHVERGMRALPRNFAFDFNWDDGHPNLMVWPRGRLGVSLSPLTDQLAEYFGAKEGVLVSSVEADSPAARAGLRAGDVITSVNGRAVDRPSDVTRELRDAEPGGEIEIDILRDRKPLSLKASIPERERPARRRLTRPA